MTMMFAPDTRTPAARSLAVYLSVVVAEGLSKGWQDLVTRIAEFNRPYEPRNAAELIEWAATYEATQPSYAADLRAAALHSQMTETAGR